MRFNLNDSSTSSMSIRAGTPPIRRNASARTNWAWSPKAMPVTMALRLFSHAIHRVAMPPPSNAIPKHPPAASGAADRARMIRSAASARSMLSACRISRTSPLAAYAAAAIWIPLPFSL